MSITINNRIFDITHSFYHIFTYYKLINFAQPTNNSTRKNSSVKLHCHAGKKCSGSTAHYRDNKYHNREKEKKKLFATKKSLYAFQKGTFISPILLN